MCYHKLGVKKPHILWREWFPCLQCPRPAPISLSPDVVRLIAIYPSTVNLLVRIHSSFVEAARSDLVLSSIIGRYVVLNLIYLSFYVCFAWKRKS